MDGGGRGWRPLLSTFMGGVGVKVPGLKRVCLIVLWAAVAAIFLSAFLVANSWAAVYYGFDRSDGASFVIQIRQQGEYGPFSFVLWSVTSPPWNPETPETGVVQILAAGPGEPGAGYGHAGEAYYQGIRTLVDMVGLDNTTFTQNGLQAQDEEGIQTGQRNGPIQAGHVEALIGLLFALILVTAYRFYP